MVIGGLILGFSGMSLKIKYKGIEIIIYMLILGMLVSQMIMYKPGSIVSPYAYSRGLLRQIEFAGQTLSSWSSMFLFLYCIYFLCVRGFAKMSKNDVIILVILIFFVLLGFISCDNISISIAQGTKVILPFAVFFVIKGEYMHWDKNVLKKFLSITNYVLLLQVVVCKLLIGKFSASQYYMEYREEYFGFYNHPHNFTGLLGILSIWNIYRIYRKEKAYSSFIMLICNIGLMYISGSRSYVVTLIISITFLCFFSFFYEDLKEIRKLSTLYFSVVILFGGVLISKLGENRVVRDISSGRIERWIVDLIYYRDSMSFVEKIFGGGFDYIYILNLKKFGVYINSLNIIIDYLINNGILGLLFIMGAYIYIFLFFIKSGHKFFSCTVSLFLLSSSMITNMVLYPVIMVYCVLVLFAIGIDTNR